MPKLIYGTAWKAERTADLVSQAITTGFRGIDTACQPKHYNESGVGSGIIDCINSGLISRSDLYLQSKFTPINGQDPDRLPYDPRANLADQVAQSCHASLTNLQTDYLDCLVLHSPLATPSQTRTAWQAMEQLITEGVVRQIGISNCYDINLLQTIFECAGEKPAVIQNRFYERTAYDFNIRQFCRQHNIIYQSFWTLTANPHLLQSTRLKQLAKTYQCNLEQVLFRFLTQIGITPLTGTTSQTHMMEDLAIFEFELNNEEVAAIESLLC